MDTKKEQEPWDVDAAGKLCGVVSVQMSGIRTERQALGARIGSGLQRES